MVSVLARGALFQIQLFLDRTISIGLFFILAGVPFIINPFALDYWYKPKIDSVYALIAIIAAAALTRQLVLKKLPCVSVHPLTMPLAAYAVASILATIFSVSPSVSIHGDIFREEGLVTLLAYISLTIIFATAVVSEKQLKDLLTALLVSGSLVSLYALVQYAGYNPTRHFLPLLRSVENRPGSTIGNCNFLGKFLVLLLPLFIVYYLMTEKRVEKLLLAAGCLVSVAALIVTFTRASWVSFIVSLIMLLIMLRGTLMWKRVKHLCVIAAGLIVVFVLVVGYKPAGENAAAQEKTLDRITKRIALTFDLQKGGIAGRLYLWRKAITLIGDRPVIGYGPDTHALVMDRFNLEYARKFNCSGLLDRAHNNYLDIAIAQGLLGLAAYLAIIITFLVWLVRTLKTEPDATRQLLYRGILAAVCGYLLNDIFTFSVVSVSPTFWSLLGLTLSIKRCNVLVQPLCDKT